MKYSQALPFLGETSAVIIAFVIPEVINKKPSSKVAAAAELTGVAAINRPEMI